MMMKHSYKLQIYGEFGFSTCTEEQQEVIIKKILDEVTIKYISK